MRTWTTVTGGMVAAVLSAVMSIGAGWSQTVTTTTMPVPGTPCTTVVVPPPATVTVVNQNPQVVTVTSAGKTQTGPTPTILDAIAFPNARLAGSAIPASGTAAQPVVVCQQTPGSFHSTRCIRIRPGLGSRSGTAMATGPCPRRPRMNTAPGDSRRRPQPRPSRMRPYRATRFVISPSPDRFDGGGQRDRHRGGGPSGDDRSGNIVHRADPPRRRCRDRGAHVAVRRWSSETRCGSAGRSTRARRQHRLARRGWRGSRRTSWRPSRIPDTASRRRDTDIGCRSTLSSEVPVVGIRRERLPAGQYLHSSVPPLMLATTYVTHIGGATIDAGLPNPSVTNCHSPGPGGALGLRRG